jgi:hypothetical protein
VLIIYINVYRNIGLNEKHYTVRTVPNVEEPRICSVCRNQNPVLSAFMTYHWVYKMSNTTGATSGAGTAYHFGAPAFSHPSPVLSGVRATRSLVLCVCVCIGRIQLPYDHDHDIPCSTLI